MHPRAALLRRIKFGVPALAGLVLPVERRRLIVSLPLLSHHSRRDTGAPRHCDSLRTEIGRLHPGRNLDASEQMLQK